MGAITHPHAESMGVETKNHSHSINSVGQTICFTDEEIVVAARLAYLTSSGTFRTLIHTDVFQELGIPRGSRLWEERNNIIKPQRLSKVLRDAGFCRVRGAYGSRKARYIIPQGV